GPPPLPSATPTVRAPEKDSRDEAMMALEARFPALVEAIAAVESEDIDAIMASLHWEMVPCTADDARSGPAPRCGDLGVPEGTGIPMFHYQLLQHSYYTLEQMHKRIETYLLGREPTLGLVATRGDGTWLVSFTVDDTD